MVERADILVSPQKKEKEAGVQGLLSNFEFEVAKHLLETRYYFDLGNLPDSPRAKRYFHKQLIPAVRQGEKVKLSTGSREMLSGFEKMARGQENIPKKWPLLVVTNHIKGKPLWGTWPAYVISEVMDNRRGQEVGFALGDRFRLWNTNKEVWGSKFIQSLIADTHDFHLVTPPWKENGKNGSNHINSWLDRLSGGGVIGLTPEAEESFELKKAYEGSGRLIKAADIKIRREGRKAGGERQALKVLPVGAWSDRNNLIVMFGQPYEVNTKASDQEAADEAMRRVSYLIPPALRGYYRHQR